MTSETWTSAGGASRAARQAAAAETDQPTDYPEARQPETVAPEAEAPEAEADGGAGQASPAQEAPPGGALAVPVLVPWLRVVRLRLPVPRTVASGAGSAMSTVRGHLPDQDRLAYYGGLAALAALGLVEWPVAAAVGVGVWVAGHNRGRAQPREKEPAA